jgi:hypothetical protein
MNGMVPLIIGHKFIDCVGCKLDNHPSFQCPFLSVPGWKGPLLKTEEHFQKRMTVHAEKMKRASDNKNNRQSNSGRDKGSKQKRPGGGFAKLVNGKHK